MDQIVDADLDAGTAADRKSRREAGQTAGIVDCDVHPTLPGGITSLYPYMPEAWAERFRRKRAHTVAGGLILRFAHPNGFILRDDAVTDDGKPAGSDPGFMVRDLLDAHAIDVAVLNSVQTGALCAVHASLDESIAIASAANEYFAAEWLTVDPRFTYSMVVSAQDPAAAAAEIRRAGRNPRVCAVSVPPISIMFGNRYWWPVYEAAQEMDLPIQLHVTGSETIYNGAPMPAGGQPDTYIERYVTLSQSAEANMISLIMSGTFERFPGLRVLFTEYGVVWPVASLLRADRLWRGLRHEVPWVKKEPSRYVDEHVWFASQPLEEPRDPADLEHLLRMVGIGNVVFSTDYPHWDNDMPAVSLRSLPEADRDRIMRTNARDVLRLAS